MTSTGTRPRLLERHFQATVIELAETVGWKVAHFADSRRQVAPSRFVGDRQAAGWPDLAMARGNRLLLVELKTDNGRISPAQREWLRALYAVEADAGGSVEVRVWRPTDFASGEIERTLIGRRS